MKILAVVEYNLKDLLRNNLGCEIVFADSWDEVVPASLPEYACVLLSAIAVESIADPLAIWAAASKIRYFDVPAAIIDASIDAVSVLASQYPLIKVISYRGDSPQFLLQLRTFVPQLFMNNPQFRNSINSAAANQLRYDENPISRMNINACLDGVRPSTGNPRSPKPGSANGFGSVASNAFGIMPKASSMSNPKVKKPAALVSNDVYRKSGRGSGRLSDFSDADFELSEISSISSISGISGIMDDVDSSPCNDVKFNKNAENKNDRVDRVDRQNPQVSEKCPPQNNNLSVSNHHSVCHESASSQYRDNRFCIERNFKDVQNGSIKFGSLIKTVTIIRRLHLTGVLEVQNETRSIRFEFRDGDTFAAAGPQYLMSALCWAVGDYNFNSNRILSNNSQAVDIQSIIYNVVHEMFPLNPLIRALEPEFQRFVFLTDCFSAAHFRTADALVQKCSGDMCLADILNVGADMPDTARDIFQAWMCDEICFMDDPGKKSIHVSYKMLDAAQSALGEREAKLRMAANGTNNADNSQINAIREDLLRVKARFASESCYSILGLKRGCGVKALDDAYYAWINRYHSDRFVRYKEPAFVKLADELLMLMNAAYAKTAKLERLNSSSLRVPTNGEQDRPQSQPDVSSRIGVGRARVSTLSSCKNAKVNSPSRPYSSDPASSANSGFNVQNNNAQDSQIPQDHIQIPSSVQARRALSMGMKARQPANLANNLNSNTLAPQTDPREASQSRFPENAPKRSVSGAQTPPNPRNAQPKNDARAVGSSPHRIENVTPAQHFMTCRKKMTLGLAEDALAAIGWAIEGDPDNLIYAAYNHYIQFLIDGNKRDESLTKISEIIAFYKKEITNNGIMTDDDKEKFFSLYYFIGKLYMASEKYNEAKDALHRAVKYNPDDVDSQRSLRFCLLQLEKMSEKNKPKSLFSSLRDKFMKS